MIQGDRILQVSLGRLLLLYPTITGAGTIPNTYSLNATHFSIVKIDQISPHQHSNISRPETTEKKL